MTEKRKSPYVKAIDLASRSVIEIDMKIRMYHLDAVSMGNQFNAFLIAELCKGLAVISTILYPLEGCCRYWNPK
jgi:hypothetical protein